MLFTFIDAIVLPNFDEFDFYYMTDVKKITDI